MEAREILGNHLMAARMTPEAYAAERGVGRSVIYKFLSGKDIRLSTWERIDPSRPTTPADAGKE